MAVALKESHTTLKCRTGQHAVRSELFPVPSTPPGHVIGAGLTSGLAFFDNGQVASLDMTFTIDWSDGKSGSHVNYSKFTFEDGSYILVLEPGTTTDSPDGTTSIVSSDSVTILQGGGQYAGIQGRGTMTGKRFGPLGPNANTYLDYVLTFSVPTK